MAWVGIEPSTREPCSHTLLNWATRRQVQLALRANFVLQLQFYYFFCVTFHFSRLRLSVTPFFQSKFSLGKHMSVLEWADTHCIHHWRILWSSHRILARVGFELTTTDPVRYALTDWDMRPWVQLALRAIFVQQLQFHHKFSVTFHLGGFTSSVATFNRNFLHVITSVLLNELIHMVFITDGFPEAALECWPEWDLNPQPLNPVQML